MKTRIPILWRTFSSAALAIVAVAAIGFTTATPANARVAFGFSVGGPVYYGGYYPYYGYTPYYGYAPYYGYPSYGYYSYPTYGYYGGSDYGYDYSR
jgi:hypothetical protein